MQMITEKLASRMLERYGLAFIWDAHIAAAAAHGLGHTTSAASLLEMAEAAERVWMRQAEGCNALS
jgi:hypothetical protein